jgi:hypothetical protein
VSKIKRVDVKKGEGREALLDRLKDELKNERITEGRYLVVIAKVPDNLTVRIRPRATKKKGGGPKKGG